MVWCRPRRSASPRKRTMVWRSASVLRGCALSAIRCTWWTIPWLHSWSRQASTTCPLLYVTRVAACVHTCMYWIRYTSWSCFGARVTHAMSVHTGTEMPPCNMQHLCVRSANFNVLLYVHSWVDPKCRSRAHDCLPNYIHDPNNNTLDTDVCVCSCQLVT